MRKDLRIKRNQIVCKYWEELRAEYTMRDIAEIFNLPLVSFYRIIRKQNETKLQDARKGLSEKEIKEIIEKWKQKKY